MCRSATTLYSPTANATAHQQLARDAGIKPVYGASINPDGSIGLSSESVNRTNSGKCDLSGTKQGNWVAAQIRSGNVQSVKQYQRSSQFPSGQLS